MEQPEFKSPRKIEEEVRDYKRSRFEYYMTEEDKGRMTRDIAIAALRDELTNIVELENGRQITA